MFPPQHVTRGPPCLARSSPSLPRHFQVRISPASEATKMESRMAIRQPVDSFGPPPVTRVIAMFHLHTCASTTPQDKTHTGHEHRKDARRRVSRAIVRVQHLGAVVGG